MKLVLVLSVLIVTVSSAVKREFNCTVVSQNNGNEMDSGGAASRDIGNYFDWNKKVPYFFEGHVTNDDKALIRNQMDVIEERTCVKFNEVEQRFAPEHRLKIIVGQGSCGDWSVRLRVDSV